MTSQTLWPCDARVSKFEGCFTPSALRSTDLGVTDPKLDMGELEMPKGVRHCTVEPVKAKKVMKRKRKEKKKVC